MPSVTQPITIGPVSIIAFTIIIFVPILHTKTPVQPFPNTTISLIPIPFFISTPFLKTPLPPPIPLQFIKLFPNKTLPFPYSLLPLHLILPPPTPTNTPPADAIIFPIINSL
ncbi:anion permease, partial [Staphylococcus epidermidis]|uniref:anion permease n=1 Tax=Staphylococcus epidermidis TaxID=1282 RepID=UPI0037DA4CDB